MTERYDTGCACEQKVNHIKCEVENCRFHECDDCCTAHMIKVTPSHADSEVDTACSTFEAID